MFLRVWEYRVLAEHEAAFVAAYGPDGDWARLFRQGPGYVGTRLSVDLDEPGRFVTIDRWQDEASWQDFLAQLGPYYRALDADLEHLTASQRRLLEGAEGNDDGL
jgi:quinol monooxygenase YgiN